MMPTFPDWPLEMVNYAKFILNENLVRSTWVDGIIGKTSIISPSELISQIFTDMDTDDAVKILKVELDNVPEFRDALDKFVSSLSALENILSYRNDVEDAQTALNSLEWVSLRDASLNLIEISRNCEELKYGDELR